MLENGHPATTAFAAILERYLSETLHERIRLEPAEHTMHLPTFLAGTYTLYQGIIANRRCVFLGAGEQATAPSDIAKHVALVRAATGDVVIFATLFLSAYNRSRLISQGVPFVVPGNQLYIPDLATDLREHFRAPRSRHSEGLTPAAQAVLFYYLLHHDSHVMTPSLIAGRLYYSAMSIGRAFDDLVAAGLAETMRLGKERHLQFHREGRDLLEAARELLRSPVRATKFIRDAEIGSSPVMKTGGETALAKLTELSQPMIATYAVAASSWKAVAEALGVIEVDEYDAECFVETWSYDPAGLSQGPVVDPLSLFAQFKDHPDERVSMAAERLLEDLPW
jgi:hypothetical protein